jgi:hypothetical protein
LISDGIQALHGPVGIGDTGDPAVLVDADDQPAAAGIGEGGQCGCEVISVDPPFPELGVQVFPARDPVLQLIQVHGSLRSGCPARDHRQPGDQSAPADSVHPLRFFAQQLAEMIQLYASYSVMALALRRIGHVSLNIESRRSFVKDDEDGTLMNADGVRVRCLEISRPAPSEAPFTASPNALKMGCGSTRVDADQHIMISVDQRPIFSE